MTSSVPDVPEGFNYGRKYGWVYQESKSFDDLETILKENYLRFKIVKLKVWSGQIDNSDIIYGIQAFYKNLITGKIIESDEYKGEGFTKVEEFEIKSNEYLSNFKVRFDTEITRIVFRTNKDNEFIVGNGKGEDKFVKVNENKNIIVSIYGAYNKYLDSLGVGYFDRNWYMKMMCFGYFELKYKLKKDEKFKQEWFSKIDKLDIFAKALLKTCCLPDSAFTEIIKYCF